MKERILGIEQPSCVPIITEIRVLYLELVTLEALGDLSCNPSPTPFEGFRCRIRVRIWYPAVFYRTPSCLFFSQIQSTAARSCRRVVYYNFDFVLQPKAVIGSRITKYLILLCFCRRASGILRSPTKLHRTSEHRIRTNCDSLQILIRDTRHEF